ncbi:DUF5104 domain-containing protein [Mogibacterium diversum]|uniref:DUF5104 domain-containing protein n=1 Tax=Mogibacterium diversum TaxID=114527 RepID=UPI0028D580D3|nr:DUF5104 domain-containing protein [Mogibacterium diversum]
MRKLTCALLCLLMILSTAFCLEGCKSREQRLNEETAYEDAQMNAMNKKIVKCINEKDKEGLKKLFSNSAQKDIEALDGKIDELFNVFDGKVIKSVRVSSKVTDGSVNVQPFSIIGKCTFSLNSKRQYIGYIDFCDKDDNNKDNVGLYMIEVCTCSREELPEEFTWEGVNSGKPGIFIHYIN